MRTEALNGLKKGDVVEHTKCNRSQWKHLNHGVVDDISMSGKSVYVRWYDADGKSFHWAQYDCGSIVRRGMRG
ncbi:hypothetical protein [Brevibacillus panacihumi]|uniref:hypothetical protein n=1 Tax=Brevibacillus panacihumi TaxID=497735 RepID=UPI003D1C30E8